MTTTIGQKLKAAREEQRLTLEKVFDATRIRLQYLQALEDDDLSVMPSPVQARGYLRNYAEFLGFDVAQLLDEFREASLQKPSEEVIGPADVPVVPEASPTDLPAASLDTPGVEEATLLIKPKPARRKKKVSGPPDDVSIPAYNGDQPSDPSLERQVEPTAVSEDANSEQNKGNGKKTARSPRQPEKREMASIPESAEELQEVVPAEPSPVPAEPEPLATLVQPQASPDLGDSLWQTWLNRLAAVLAARNRRPTMIVKEPAVAVESLEESNPPEVEEEPVFPPDGTENSTEILKEIGRKLRERRELLSLHLEEVERNTHVKAHYLDALERGAMDDLPSTVQTRGMLSNYATFLDLDVDAILLRFADALQARYRERNPQKPVRKPGQPIVASLPPMRSFIAGDMIFGIGIVLLLVGFAIWGVSRVLTLQSQQVLDPTAPSISDILLAPSEASPYTATPSPISIESFPGEATITVVIPTLNADVNVQVNLVAAERTYMRVTADGQVVFEGRVLPGTAYPFEAEDQIEVLVGNGAAIRIVYNGRDLGLLGSFGQVVNNIYRADEIITPTGIPTETATITLTPTQTALPSATSRSTATAGSTSTSSPVP